MWLVAAIITGCISVTFIDGGLTSMQARGRTETTAVMLLGALSQRRVASVRETGIEVNSAQAVAGFTLIELSIVLVVIGLVIGGVLVGRDLISAAAVRSQISQIEKFQTAVTVFRSKYDYLPGDIPAGPAVQFGFAGRGVYIGEGDGNNVIQGVFDNRAAAQSGLYHTAGETVMFWADLGKVNLIDGAFTVASSYVIPACNASLNTGSYLPQSKISSSSYVLAWSQGGLNALPIPPNYLWLGGITQLCATNACPNTIPGLTVAQSFAMDKKIDDGLPQSGNVLAISLGGAWSGGYAWNGYLSAPFTTATAGSSASCFDNGNTTGGVQQYSVTTNNGKGVNCDLAFKLQAGN